MTAIRSGDYYMFDEFDDELDSIVEKDNELSDDSLEDSDKTDTDKFDYQVRQQCLKIKYYFKFVLFNLIISIFFFFLEEERNR